MSVLRSPFPTIVVCVLAYGALAVLLATAPQNALGFWPGLFAGIIGCTLWRTFRTPPTCAQTQRRLRIAGPLLVVWFALALVPQRDIPVAGAPLGLLTAWTLTLVLDQRRPG
jgi:hypothetical protein